MVVPLPSILGDIGRGVHLFKLQSFFPWVVSASFQPPHPPITNSLLLQVSSFPQGVFLSRLLENFSWLTEETLLRGFDVGFSGQLQDLVMHGLCLLHGSLSLWLLPQGDVLVLPRAGPTLAQLAYHGAALLPVFLYEAVGGKSHSLGLGKERGKIQGDFPVNTLRAPSPLPFLCGYHSLECILFSLVPLSPFLSFFLCLACAVRALLAGRVPPEGPWELQGVELLSQRELHRQTLLLLHLLPQDLLLLQVRQAVFAPGAGPELQLWPAGGSSFLSLPSPASHPTFIARKF